MNDKGAVILLAWPANDGLHFLDCLHHSDALASVRVFTWLDDPSVLWSPVFLINLLYSVLVICVYLTGIIIIFGLLFVCCIPLISVKLLDSLLGLPLAGAMPLLHLVVVVGEPSELRVVNTLLRVECQREYLEGVLAKGLVVLPHVHKHAFFVRKLLVLLKLIIEAEWKGNFVNPSGLLRRGRHQYLLLDWLFRFNRSYTSSTTWTPKLSLL